MKLAHVALASAGLMTISYAIAQLHSPSECTAGPCKAVIVLPSGCGGGITVAPNPIRVLTNKAPTTIEWKVASPDWQFDSKAGGIVIHPPGSPFKATPHAKVTTTSISMDIDPTGPKAVYKYDINLVSKAGPCKVDPTIVNY